MAKKGEIRYNKPIDTESTTAPPPQTTRRNIVSRKLNIIFFFSDQQRWDTAGCYGQPLNITPIWTPLRQKA